MIRRLALLALAGALAAPQLTAQSEPSVTLFNSGRTLVRRSLPIQLPSGNSTQQLVLGLFDPSSFAVLDPDVTVERIEFDGDYSERSLLRRNIGHEFTFLRGDEKQPVRARLLGIDPERWLLAASVVTGAPEGIVFERPGQIIWPADQIPAAPIADVTFDSDGSTNDLSVMYETQGGAWQASYRLYLGQRSRIEGVATIGSGILDIPAAHVQLLAGDIGQRNNYRPAPMMQDMMASARVGAAEGKMANESIGEVQLYTLPGLVTFTPGTMVVVPLFETMQVSPVRRLSVTGALPMWGGIGQEGDEREVPVEVRWRIERDQGTAFGDLPLPGGLVTVYDTDSGGRIQLIGQGNIGHTGAGELFEISTGSAFDVTARRTQTEYSISRSANGQRTTVLVSYRVDLVNAKDSAVVVDVIEARSGDWSIVSSSIPATRPTSSRAVFPVNVPANGEASVTYSLRVVW